MPAFRDVVIAGVEKQRVFAREQIEKPYLAIADVIVVHSHDLVAQAHGNILAAADGAGQGGGGVFLANIHGRVLHGSANGKPKAAGSALIRLHQKVVTASGRNLGAVNDRLGSFSITP